MVCARVRAKMDSLTLVHYRYVHVHSHGISKTYHYANISVLMKFYQKSKDYEFSVKFQSLSSP